MTVLGIDNFIRPNQSTWGTASDGQTWSRVRGTATWNIVSNEGAANSASSLSIFRIGSQTPGDAELLVRITPADTTSNVGIIARFQDSNNFYYGVLNAGFLIIGKDAAGTFTTLKSATFVYSAGTAYWLRFRVLSNNLFLKAWQDGTAEPSTWTDTITDSTFASGGFGLASDSSSATNTLFDSFYTVDYLNCENLSVADSFLSTESASFAEANSVSDALSIQNGFIPLDSMSAADILFANEAARWADLLSITDSFTGTSSPPIPPAINCTMLVRKGTATMTARKGTATMQSRKGTITLYGRKE